MMNKAHTEDVIWCLLPQACERALANVVYTCILMINGSCTSPQFWVSSYSLIILLLSMISSFCVMKLYLRHHHHHHYLNIFFFPILLLPYYNSLSRKWEVKAANKLYWKCYSNKMSGHFIKMDQFSSSL